MRSGERKALKNGWYVERHGFGKKTWWVICTPLGNAAGNIYSDNLTDFLELIKHDFPIQTIDADKIYRKSSNAPSQKA